VSIRAYIQRFGVMLCILRKETKGVVLFCIPNEKEQGTKGKLHARGRSSLAGACPPMRWPIISTNTVQDANSNDPNKVLFAPRASRADDACCSLSVPARQGTVRLGHGQEKRTVISLRLVVEALQLHHFRGHVYRSRSSRCSPRLIWRLNETRCVISHWCLRIFTHYQPR
jgi:hypothetical protein